nr:AP-3 complex subunit mu [Cryptococcus depauperatus CBS 7841]
MTKIDGIIILDSNGKPIISSNFTSFPPSYASLHIDAFNVARKKALTVGGDSKSMEPVLWVNILDSARTGMTGAGLCHSERNGLWYLIPVAHEVNPLLAFSFLDSFLYTLRDYLGDVTETTIKDNFDIVYMLIEEMLDEGHPMTMEPSMLKEIVLPPTLVRKIFNAAGVSGLQSTTTSPFTAPIPWRKPGIRHSSNEIYLDIVESLDAIIDQKGNLLSSHIWGRIDCNARLSGNPDLLLNFGNPRVMSQCAFHPCIRYNRWSKDSTLSFIPPDGKFRLAEYETEPGSMKAQVPLQVKGKMMLENYGGRFALTLIPRLTHLPLENIVVSISLGKGANSVSATATGDRRPLHIQVGRDETAVGFVGGGTWDFDPLTQVLKWSLGSLVSTERAPSLTGSFASTEKQPIISPSFKVDFAIQNHSFSNLKVDKLRVQGDVTYKPFKGIKMLAKSGKIEVRW